MIEINLSPSKKSGSLTNIGGIDLSLINVKMLVIALFVLYVPEIFVESYYEEKTTTTNAEQAVLSQELRQLKQQVGQMENVKKQVDALLDQEEKLARKLKVVQEVINKRQNPYKVLKYIADNIPEGVWLVSMELEDTELVMRGYSRSFKNISKFLENLKNSIFFRKNILYDRPDMSEEFNGVALEVFEIKASIASFE